MVRQKQFRGRRRRGKLKRNKGFRLKIDSSAQVDLKIAIDWYKAQQIGLGKRFLDDFETTLIRIQSNPYMFRLEGNYKNTLLDIFPYIVIFEIEDQEIIILAVFNTHQNPTKKTIICDRILPVHKSFTSYFCNHLVCRAILYSAFIYISYRSYSKT
ncbi:type II toxin-antitoxin system RelE/ParE family toxin [Salegentibacter salinarum]|uniref:type II toxin-antitoxin system RelE/ParE family toxin n=1 Tax=Salegentibacter salinarum TaxID=447422 RepID=UPI0009A59D88